RRFSKALGRPFELYQLVCDAPSSVPPRPLTALYPPREAPSKSNLRAKGPRQALRDALDHRDRPRESRERRRFCSKDPPKGPSGARDSRNRPREVLVRSQAISNWPPGGYVESVCGLDMASAGQF